MLTDREKALVINSLRSYMKALAEVVKEDLGDIDATLAMTAKCLGVPIELLEPMRVEHQLFLITVRSVTGWDLDDGE